MNNVFIEMLSATFGLAYTMIALAVGILTIIGRWKVFEKAGKPGWGAIVPFYSEYCLYEMTFGVGWLFLLDFICIGFIFRIIRCFKLATSFRLGGAFGVGLWLLNPIFMMILGFGNYEYYGINGQGFGPNGTSANSNDNPYYR